MNCTCYEEDGNTVICVLCATALLVDSMETTPNPALVGEEVDYLIYEVDTWLERLAQG